MEEGKVLRDVMTLGQPARGREQDGEAALRGRRPRELSPAMSE